jgi:solute carrier family 50 protein (sugar transporter)
MVVNAFVWMVYGLLIREKKVWLTNFIGSLMGLFYCNKFSKYCKPTAKNLPGTKGTHLFGSILIMLLASAIGSLLPVKLAASIVGIMGVVFCIILFASPLASLKEVVATKSAKSIPLPFCLVACVNTLMWSVVGLFEMKDFMIYAPNLLGLAFSLLQVALKLVYGNGPKQKLGGAGIAMSTSRGGGFNLPI